MSDKQLAALTDESLQARFELLFDLTTTAWAMAASLTGVCIGVFSAIDNKAGTEFASSLRGGIDDLVSAGAVRAVERLADLARDNQQIREILRSFPPSDALKQLSASCPSFASEFARVVADYGHRGPKEAELTSLVFGDAPDRLIDAVAKRVESPPRIQVQPAKRKGTQRVMALIAVRTQRAREVGRDGALRFEHQYRHAARELGRRLVACGRLGEVEDVFYLTRSEVARPPADVRQVVEQRRSDRSRLESQRPPADFVTAWTPAAIDERSLDVGEKISGLGVSPGQGRGPVRIMDAVCFEDFQPGEVLVTVVTDSGWTPLFAYASAVVTEVGGRMSHAAVVARELNVPCVVMATGAATRLATGQIVEVDGTSGRIKAITPAARTAAT